MSVKYIKNIQQKNPIDVIIPAAGMGRRMKSYGPKSLIKIKKDLTLIENQIKIIKNTIPNSNIIIVAGFESNLLMNKTPENIIKLENENYQNTNVIRSIGIGLRASQQEVLIIYGDLVFNSECIENLDFNKSSIVVGKKIMKDSEVGCIVNKQDKVENMMYDLENKWGQILFLTGKELNIFKNICWNPENYNMFGFEAINETISKGGKIKACADDKMRIIDIDSSKDLERVKEII